MTPDRYEPSGGFQDSPQTCKASEASETVWGCGMDPNKLHSLPSRSLAEAEVWNFLGLARLLLLLALLLLSLSLFLFADSCDPRSAFLAGFRPILGLFARLLWAKN